MRWLSSLIARPAAGKLAAAPASTRPPISIVEHLPPDDSRGGLAHNGALRRSEVAALRWADIERPTVATSSASPSAARSTDRDSGNQTATDYLPWMEGITFTLLE